MDECRRPVGACVVYPNVLTVMRFIECCMTQTCDHVYTQTHKRTNLHQEIGKVPMDWYDTLVLGSLSGHCGRQLGAPLHL